MPEGGAATSGSRRRPRSSGSTEYLERKPKALSGGQRQRVAMGRAIVRSPQVFCMDEPLSNLDAKMRVQTRTDIAKLQADLGVTTVYVTHDQVEAMTMGDRVAVMKLGDAPAGRHPAQALRQAGQPLRRRLHRLPADEPARGARGQDGKAQIGEYAVPVDPPASLGDAAARSPSAYAPRRGGWSAQSEGGLPVDGRPSSRSSAPTASSTAPATSRARPHNIIVRVSARHKVQKGDVLHVTTDPRARARLRHRDRGAAEPLMSDPLLERVGREVRAGDALGPSDGDAFLARLALVWPDLVEALSEVYADVPELVPDLVADALTAAVARPAPLRALDRRREIDPAWFLRQDLIGYVCYADRFAGSIAAVAEHLDYLARARASATCT